MAEPTKRVRAKKRDYKKEIDNLRAYCKVSLEILKEDLGETGADPRTNAKMETFEKVLGKIGE